MLWALKIFCKNEISVYCMLFFRGNIYETILEKGIELLGFGKANLGAVWIGHTQEPAPERRVKVQDHVIGTVPEFSP